MKYRFINGKYLVQNTTGVQRVASEMHEKLKYPILSNNWDGLVGHLYEQLILPFNLPRDSVLISFCNTGPIAVKDQVIYIHDVAVLEHPEWFSRLFYLLYRVLLPILARRAKVIVTVSEYSKLRICDFLNISKDKVYVVKNGVSDRFSKGLEFDFNVAHTLGLERRKYILTVGSLDPRKNLQSIFTAWQESGLDSDGYKLVVVGGSNASFASQENFDLNESIIFSGRVSDNVLYQLYSNASGFIYMSLYEGFGLPVLEAMRSGVPVLCSNTTALKELADTGYCLSCSPYSIREISLGLKKLLETSQETIDMARIFAESCSWDSSAKQLEDIIDKEFK